MKVTPCSAGRAAVCSLLSLSAVLAFGAAPAANHEATFAFSRGDNPPDLDWTVGLETGDPEKGPWQTNWFHSAQQKLTVTKLGDGQWRFTCSRFSDFQRTMAVDFRLDVEVKDGKTVASGSLKNLEDGTQMFVFKGPFVRAASRRTPT